MMSLSFLFLLLDFCPGLAEPDIHKASLRFPFDLPKGNGAWIRPTVGQIWPKPQLEQVCRLKFCAFKY